MEDSVRFSQMTKKEMDEWLKSHAVTGMLGAQPRPSNRWERFYRRRIKPTLETAFWKIANALDLDIE